jgi:hypothetical protein
MHLFLRVLTGERRGENEELSTVRKLDRLTAGVPGGFAQRYQELGRNWCTSSTRADV